MTSTRTLATALLLLLAGLLAAGRAADEKKAPPAVSVEKIQQLIQQLGDDSFTAREAATADLIKIGRPAVRHLRAASKSDDPEVRCRVRQVLDSIPLTLDALMEDLKDEDAIVRRDAAEALERMGTSAKPAVPALLALLKDKDEAVQDAVLGALMAIDPENKGIADASPSKARVNGKYAKLLKRIKVPQDRQSYTDFTDYGHYPATNYAGYDNIPEGYWVYVYPYWYIWGEMKN
jgi:hypothetical protein